METRANYVLIGVFTLAIVVAVFGFVFWFQNIGGTGERSFYRVVFTGSVSGLQTGGSVLFNGIRVGEVTGLKLNPEKPEQVVATISVDKSVPMRKDTNIGLEFQGLTGIAAMSLSGGTVSAPPLVGTKENPPELIANPDATQDLAKAAREVLKRIDTFIAENQASFKEAVKNVETFSGALARNADKVDRVMAGLENLTGGKDGKSGEINEAARSIQDLAKQLDKRTVELTGDARRTLLEIERAVKNFDRNPSRLIFGGSGSQVPEYNGKK